jgi:thiol-disulfide isomerase/thioredoxin
MSEASRDVVHKFSTEDDFYDRIDLSDPVGKPQFVKFYESWCTHCKAARRPFAHAAVEFEGRVDFVEVECSKSEENQSFCNRHGVRSYPMFKLFSSESSDVYESSARSLIGFEEFLGTRVE